MVPFTAGGIADGLARTIGERLEASLKQPFIVENLGESAKIIARDTELWRDTVRDLGLKATQ